jgi:hypothetical protein
VLSSAGRDQIAADEDEREQHQDEIEWSEGDKRHGRLSREVAVEHRGSDRDTTRASSAHNYAVTAMVRQAHVTFIKELPKTATGKIQNTSCAPD